MNNLNGVFVIGGSEFIGTRLVRRLLGNELLDIKILTKHPVRHFAI